MAFKIIKYIQKTFDIWIHKSTVIVSFCEGNYWFRTAAMSFLGHFAELSLQLSSRALPVLKEVDGEVGQAPDVFCH